MGLVVGRFHKNVLSEGGGFLSKAFYGFFCGFPPAATMKNLSKNKKNYCHLLLLTERKSYASKELLKFFLMASLKSSNVRMNPIATTLDKPLFYAFRPLRSLLSKVRLTRMYSIDLITTK